MNKRSDFIYVLILIIIVSAFGIMFYQNILLKGEKKRIELDLRYYEKNAETYINNCSSTLIHSWNISGESINDLKIVDSLNCTYIPDSTIFRSDCFYFFLSQLHCSSCIEDLLSKISGIVDSLGSERIVFFGHYQKKRDLKVYLDRYKLGCKAYLLDRNCPIYPIDSEKPVVLTINSRGEIVNYFTIYNEFLNILDLFIKNSQ